jgi:hypothetical protein
MLRRGIAAKDGHRTESSNLIGASEETEKRKSACHLPHPKVRVGAALKLSKSWSCEEPSR